MSLFWLWRQGSAAARSIARAGQGDEKKFALRNLLATVPLVLPKKKD